MYEYVDNSDILKVFDENGALVRSFKGLSWLNEYELGFGNWFVYFNGHIVIPMRENKKFITIDINL